MKQNGFILFSPACLHLLLSYVFRAKGHSSYAPLMSLCSLKLLAPHLRFRVSAVFSWDVLFPWIFEIFDGEPTFLVLLLQWDFLGAWFRVMYSQRCPCLLCICWATRAYSWHETNFHVKLMLNQAGIIKSHANSWKAQVGHFQWMLQCMYTLPLL